MTQHEKELNKIYDKAHSYKKDTRKKSYQEELDEAYDRAHVN